MYVLLFKIDKIRLETCMNYSSAVVVALHANLVLALVNPIYLLLEAIPPVRQDDLHILNIF